MSTIEPPAGLGTTGVVLVAVFVVATAGLGTVALGGLLDGGDTGQDAPAEQPPEAGATPTPASTDAGSARFVVSDLDAPHNATRGTAVDVSATVANRGTVEGSRTVEFRLDANGDGTLAGNESLDGTAVTLQPGARTTVSFERVDTGSLEPGAYGHGVFVDGDAETATLAVEPPGVGNRSEDGVGTDGAGSAENATEPVENGTVRNGTGNESDGDDGNVADWGDDDSDDSSESGDSDDSSESGDSDDSSESGDSDDSSESDGEDGRTGTQYTRDNITQAKYGLDFDELSAETTGEIQAIYNRQPFPDGTEPGDVMTRAELAEARHGLALDELSPETTAEIQNAYDAQFAPLPEDPEYTRDNITQAKYGLDFGNLSAETSGQIQALYNRQPFPAGTGPSDLRTREEIAEDEYGTDVDGSELHEALDREQLVAVQNAYDAQFDGDG
jgi:hypothetical protein